MKKNINRPSEKHGSSGAVTRSTKTITTFPVGGPTPKGK